MVYYIGGIGLTPERATGFAYRLIFLGAMFCLARRWNSTVASGCALSAALFLVGLGVAAYAWTGRLACALCSIYLSIRAGNRPGSRLPADICGRIGSFSTGASHVCNEPNASSEFGSDASNQMVRSPFKILRRVRSPLALPSQEKWKLR